MKFVIPPPYKRTLNKLAAMTEKQRQSIRKALDVVPANLKPKLISKQAAEHLKEQVSDLEDIVQMLFGLNMSRLSANVSTEQLAKDIVDAMENEQDLPKAFHRASFLPSIQSLLEAPSIALSSHAAEVQHEYENLFDAVRILSDIRPIFGPSGSDILGMMIVHNLEVTYFHGGEYKEVFFAMDDADLAALRKTLDRAENKSASLEKTIKAAKIPYFDSK